MTDHKCTCGNNFANPEPYCAIHDPGPAASSRRVEEVYIRSIEEVVTALGLTAGATLQDVQRRLHVGTADAMRLLALREAIEAALTLPCREAQHEKEKADARVSRAQEPEMDLEQRLEAIRGEASAFIDDPSAASSETFQRIVRLATLCRVPPSGDGVE